jgi:hypothetical protein
MKHLQELLDPARVGDGGGRSYMNGDDSYANKIPSYALQQVLRQPLISVGDLLGWAIVISTPSSPSAQIIESRSFAKAKLRPARPPYPDESSRRACTARLSCWWDSQYVSPYCSKCKHFLVRGPTVTLEASGPPPGCIPVRLPYRMDGPTPTVSRIPATLEDCRVITLIALP